MKKEIIDAIDELQKRIESLAFMDELIYKDEISECIEDFKAEVSGKKYSLKNLTWEQIEDYLQDPAKKRMFKVGDTREDALYTGEKITSMLISLKPHDELADYEKCANAAFMFFVDGEYEMNENCTNKGSWEDSKMRNAYMSRFYKLLPEDMKRVIKTVVKKTAISEKDGEIQFTDDKLFIPSEVEVTGKTNYSYDGEGEIYEYFKENKLPNKWMWLRSPYPSSTTYFAYWYNGGYVFFSTAGSAVRVALCFCI